jgi:hypothetical protein
MTLPVLLLALACNAQQKLIENTSIDHPAPEGSSFANKAPDDPQQTGVAIQPRVQHVIGPAELVILNRTDDDLWCEVYEGDGCPSLDADAFDGLAPLPAGKKWELPDVDCAILDVACMPPPGDDTTAPLRSWSWYVEPPPQD